MDETDLLQRQNRRLTLLCLALAAHHSHRFDHCVGHEGQLARI